MPAGFSLSLSIARSSLSPSPRPVRLPPWTPIYVYKVYTSWLLAKSRGRPRADGRAIRQSIVKCNVDLSPSSAGQVPRRRQDSDLVPMLCACLGQRLLFTDIAPENDPVVRPRPVCLQCGAAARPSLLAVAASARALPFRLQELDGTLDNVLFPWFPIPRAGLEQLQRCCRFS